MGPHAPGRRWSALSAPARGARSLDRMDTRKAHYTEREKPMSRSWNIGAIVLAMTFASGCNDEPVAVGGVTAPEPQASVTGSPRDAEAIQQIVTTFDETWGSDPVTYAAQYGSIIDWVGPSGLIIKDPAALTVLYTNLFTGFFAGTTRVSTIRKLTFLTGTVAVLDIDAEIIGIAGAREKNVIVKRAGEWRILMHQATALPQ